MAGPGGGRGETGQKRWRNLDEAYDANESKREAREMPVGCSPRWDAHAAATSMLTQQRRRSAVAAGHAPPGGYGGGARVRA